MNVTAQDITISGAAGNNQLASGFFAESKSSTRGGAAGGISIQCKNLTSEAGGVISAAAVAASAGDITVNVNQDVTLEYRSSVSSSAGIGGGNIAFTVGGLFYLLDSSITTTAGTLVNRTGGSIGNAGNGGNITIDPEFIVLNDRSGGNMPAIGSWRTGVAMGCEG